MFTSGMLLLLGAIAQINPVWLIGPFRPGDITAGAVPDWYMGFLDGALRVMPAWLTGRQGPSRPRDASIRTALGVAGMTFYGALWAAAANDQLAYHFDLDIYGVTWFFRIAALAGPPLAFLTRRICLGLAGRERDEAEHGLLTGRIVMNRDGGFTEITGPAIHAAPVTDGQSGKEARRHQRATLDR